MLESLDYVNLFQYSPRGTTEVSKLSRNVKAAIKGGRIEQLRPRISKIIMENQDELADFLNENVTIIPVPRSSPIKESDLWPANEIAKLLASLDCGIVSTCLYRNEAIRKSSLSYTADQRPTIAEQYNSLRVRNYVPTANITLVDDVLTLGRTFIAAASRLADKFPNATIRGFALIKTKGFDQIETIQKLENSNITYNPSSGKCSRHD